MGHIESDGGSQVERRGGCRADSCGHAATGEPPVFMKPPSRGAWRCKRGRGRSLPGRADEPRRWQARRAETGLAATVGHRHAAAAAWVGSAKASRAISQHLLRLRPSRTARRRIAHYNSATPRPPRPRDAARGAVDRASRDSSRCSWRRRSARGDRGLGERGRPGPPGAGGAVMSLAPGRTWAPASSSSAPSGHVWGLDRGRRGWRGVAGADRGGGARGGPHRSFAIGIARNGLLP